MDSSYLRLFLSGLTRYYPSVIRLSSEKEFDEMLNHLDKLTCDKISPTGTEHFFTLSPPPKWSDVTDSYYLFTVSIPVPGKEYATIEKKIIGYAFVSVSHRRLDGTICWLEAFEIHKSYRHMGHGKQFLWHIRAMIPDTLYLTTPPKTARFFHKCRGWPIANSLVDVIQNKSIFFFPKHSVFSEADYEYALRKTRYSGSKGYTVSEDLWDVPM